jgi:hypothetical protein
MCSVCCLLDKKFVVVAQTVILLLICMLYHLLKVNSEEVFYCIVFLLSVLVFKIAFLERIICLP